MRHSDFNLFVSLLLSLLIFYSHTDKQSEPFIPTPLLLFLYAEISCLSLIMFVSTHSSSPSTAQGTLSAVSRACILALKCVIFQGVVLQYIFVQMP